MQKEELEDYKKYYDLNTYLFGGEFSKKAKDGMARYCLPSGMGSMAEFDGEYATHVDNDIVERVLNETRLIG